MGMFTVIPGTDGFYSVDRCGNIRSNDRVVFNEGSQKYNKIKGRLLKPTVNNKGYCYVDFMINKRKQRWLVHRLVALTFISNPNDFPLINHKDCNPLNNSVDNLEWCDWSMNIQYAYDHGNRSITDKMMSSFKKSKEYLWRSIEATSVQTNEVMIFQSLTEAAGFVLDSKLSKAKPTTCRTNIGMCARGKLKTAYGYVWKYIETSSKV